MKAHGSRVSYGRSATLSRRERTEGQAAQRRFAIESFSRGYADAQAGRPMVPNQGPSYGLGYAAVGGHEHQWDLLPAWLIGPDPMCACGTRRILAGA